VEILVKIGFPSGNIGFQPEFNEDKYSSGNIFFPIGKRFLLKCALCNANGAAYSLYFMQLVFPLGNFMQEIKFLAENRAKTRV